MRSTGKRLTALLLAMCMSVSLLSVNVWAAEPEEDGSVIAQSSVEAPPEEVPEEEDGDSSKEEEAPPEGEEDDRSEEQLEAEPERKEKTAPSKKKETNDLVLNATGGKETTKTRIKQAPEEDLFLGYLERQAGTDELKTQEKTKCAKDKLIGVDATLYELLEREIVKVANGECASTEFTFSAEDLGLNLEWTQEELGVTIGEQVNGDWKITQEAEEAVLAKIGTIDYHSVYSALRTDHPYEYYWQDYSKDTISIRDHLYNFGTQNAVWYVRYKGTLTVKMPVYSDYAAQGADYKVDTTIAQNAKQTVTRAQAVVDAHANESDLQKLDSYREEICDRVTYNQAAADGLVGDIGNPWQIIWVFDVKENGDYDDSTNVVCEGYSKAFQFLCDLSNFQSNEIYSLCAVGTMTSGDESGSHMWNIVHMDDGKNYLVDVTNCDGTSIGAPDQLFLAAAASGSYAEGYTYACQGGNVTYTYGVETPQLYSEEELTMSMTAYEEPQDTTLKSQIASIEVGDITRFSFDREECFYGDDQTWERVDCYPEELTITLKDGTVFILGEEPEEKGEVVKGAIYCSDMNEMGNRIAENLDLSVNLFWDSTEKMSERWEETGLHNGVENITDCAFIALAQLENNQYVDDVVQPYSVRVVTLKDIEVEDVEERSMYRRVNDDEEDDPNKGKVDCWPDRVQLTITEGEESDRTFPAEGYTDVRNLWHKLRNAYPGLRYINFDWRSNEDLDSTLKDGDNIHAQFFLYGYYNPNDANEYKGICGEYTVTVKDNSPFETSVCNVGDLTRFDSDRTDEGCVNCEPDEENSVTVKLKDEEEPIIGKLWEVEEKLRDDYDMDVDLWWESDEDPKKGVTWTAREEPYTARLMACVNEEDDEDFEVTLCTYNVKVIANPIASVHVENIEVFETYYNEEEYWDKDSTKPYDKEKYGEYRHRYNRLDCWPDEITVTLSGAYGSESKTGNDDEIREWLETTLQGDDAAAPIDFDWRSGQDEDHKAIEVKDNFTTAKFSICGVWSEPYDVRVKASPVANIEVNDLTVMSNQRQTVDWEDDVDDWERYDCDPTCIKVKLQEGYKGKDEDGNEITEYSGDPWDVKDWVSWYCDGFDADRGTGMWWESEEHPANEEKHVYANFWVTDDDIPDEGKKYPNGATYHFGGATASYDVTIVKAMTVEIGDIPDIWRLTSDTNENWSDEERCRFRRIDCWPEDDLTLTVNGKSYTGDLGDIERKLQEALPGYRIECDWYSAEKPNKGAGQDEDGCYPGNWEANRVYSDENGAWVEILGVRKYYTVHVVDINSIIDSVVVDPVNITLDYRRPIGEDTDDDGEDDWWWNRLDCYPNSVKVLLKSEGGSAPLTWEEDGKEEDTTDLDEIRWRLEDYLRENGYPGIRVDTDWWSDEKPEWEGTPDAQGHYPGTWTTAGEYKDGATASIGSFEQTYDVVVTDNPIASVSVAPITRFETDREEEWDDDVKWQAVNIWPDTEITVTFDNHAPVIGFLYADDDDEEYSLRYKLKAALTELGYGDLELGLDCETTEARTQIWKAGDIGKATFFLCGNPYEFDVNVIANPVTSMDIPDQVIPGDREKVWRMNHECVDCMPDTGTVKAKVNGEDVTIDLNNLEDEDLFDALEDVMRPTMSNMRRWEFDWESDETAEEPWELGKYTAYLNIFGARFPYTVYVNPWPDDKDSLDNLGPGDFTGDDDITMADVTIGNQVVVGMIQLTDNQKRVFDVTGDKLYTMADVVWTNGYVLGKHKTRTKETS